MLNKKSVDDINVKGKRVLVRCDFNVPLKEGKITDENRLVAALPTIKKLIADGGKVILCSHLGKPKGEPKPELSLAPVAVRLSELLGQEVKFAADPEVVGPNARAAVEAMKDGEAAGYSYWKMAVSMKAAILTAEKKREEAVALYEEIAGKAVERKDPYYVMEGYRMCGFLRYEEGKLEQAFEYFLLALAGGSYLSEDIRRGSTFTYAAHLALHTGRQVRAPIDIEVLERQLHEWLGEDWKELVENPSMRQAEARRKGGIFN